MTKALLAAGVAAALGGAAVLGNLAAKRPPKGGPALLEGASAWTVPEFALKDDAGRVVRRADLAGKPWIAAFIYATCGTQCPMMTAKMKALRGRLPEGTLVSFSVDSSDTPERLAAYKESYGADWLFLTGAKGEVRRLCAEGFKLAVADGSDPSTDPILHSDKLVLVDRDARVRGFFDPSDAGHLAALESALKSL